MAAPNNLQSAGMARYLSQTDVWAIAFGCIIGWGAFVMPGTTFLPTAGPGGTVIAMAVSAVIMLIIGTNYAFLMTRRPGTGGVYTYTKEAFGRDHAFLCSWFLSLSYMSIVFLNATALFVVSRTLFGDLFQVGWHYQIAGYHIYLSEVALSVATLVIIGLLFILKKPFLQRIQTILAILLLLGTVIITVVCLSRFRAETLFSNFSPDINDSVSVILTIVLLSPWAFVGFDVISLETAHFEFPIKKSHKIIALSILLGGFVYAAMSLVSVTAVPDNYPSWQSYINHLDDLSGVATVPTFYAAKEIIGGPGLIIMGVTALAAILTGVIGAYRAATRVLSTMAEDRILSERFSSTSFCILFIMVISIVISFLGRNALEWFVELTTFGAIVGFGYTSASAFKIAKAENNKKIKITGVIGTGITVAFVIVQLIPKVTAFETMGAESFLMLAFWCLLGFLFYWKTMSQSQLPDYGGVSTSSTVLFSLLLYSVLMWFTLKLLNATAAAGLRTVIIRNIIILVLVIFIGLVVMLYIQNLLKQRHDTMEREKIHAEESSRAKSQFLFTMSHDIRTPMNAIIGFTRLALGENTSEAEKDAYLRKIDSSGQQLLEIINDILEMSRIESGAVELICAPEDITALLEETKDLFDEQMREKDISFSVDSTQVRHPWVLCDKKSLHRVLLNLLSNAYKFTPAGGSIAVSLWETDGGEEQRRFELRVKDNGIGMSAEFAERMFSAFERERTSTVSGIQGTGLGLAITKNLVDLMGGDIEVVTAPGAGTEFILRLAFNPAAAGDSPAREEKTAADKKTDFSGKRLLLAEDNEINREIAKLLLTQFGFEVEEAKNGKDAADMVAAASPGHYDAVLMDIQMPVMDGYAATRAIRGLENEALARIPIIAMTANAFKEDELAAAEAGMQAHVAKPLDVDKMLRALSDVLND